MATEGGVGAGGYGDRTATAHNNKRASGGEGRCVGIMGRAVWARIRYEERERVVLFCTGREELRACGAVCVARRVEKTR